MREKGKLLKGKKRRVNESRSLEDNGRIEKKQTLRQVLRENEARD